MLIFTNLPRTDGQTHLSIIGQSFDRSVDFSWVM